jgi:hypothetical protein
MDVPEYGGVIYVSIHMFTNDGKIYDQMNRWCTDGFVDGWADRCIGRCVGETMVGGID